MVQLSMLLVSGPLSAQTPPVEEARTKYGEALGALVQGSVDRAYALLTEAARLDPLLAPALYNAGYLAAVRGDSASARIWWSRFLAVNPRSVFAGRVRTYLGSGVHKAGDTVSYEAVLQEAWRRALAGELDEAAALLERGYQSQPDRWEAPAMLGRVLMEYGDYDLASIALMVAYRLAPADSQVRVREVLYQIERHFNPVGRNH